MTISPKMAQISKKSINHEVKQLNIFRIASLYYEINTGNDKLIINSFGIKNSK